MSKASIDTPALRSADGPDESAALLDELDIFFSEGQNTDRVRRFIEENDDTLNLIAAVDSTNADTGTDTEASLRLYQLFQRYVKLMEAIVHDFVASRKGGDERVVPLLASAIQHEWKTPTVAYRCMCTSYLAASVTYADFLEFVEDLYGLKQYTMLSNEEMEGSDEEEEEEEENVVRSLDSAASDAP